MKARFLVRGVLFLIVSLNSLASDPMILSIYNDLHYTPNIYFCFNNQNAMRQDHICTDMIQNYSFSDIINSSYFYNGETALINFKCHEILPPHLYGNESGNIYIKADINGVEDVSGECQFFIGSDKPFIIKPIWEKGGFSKVTFIFPSVKNK